jgi:hypothetical protein
MTATQGEHLITTYTEMIAAIDAARQRRGWRHLDFEKLVDMAEGSWAKVAGPVQMRRLGPEKFFDAMRAAGLKIIAEDDPEQIERMNRQVAKKLIHPGQLNQARNGNHASAISTQVLSRAFGHVLREARKKRWVGKSKTERSEHARKIANMRWKRVRKRRAAAQLGRKRQRERMKNEDLLRLPQADI